MTGLPPTNDPCLQALLDGLRPAPALSVSQWAEAHRVLDGTVSPIPGKWRNSVMPPLVGIMDALSPSDPCQFVALQKGAQVGGTEVGNNWVGHTIHHDPCPMLVVQSSVSMGEDYSKRRLQHLIDTTPELSARVAVARSRDTSNTLAYKEFPGGSVTIRGANAPAGLRSNPIRKLFLDEVDSYQVDVKDEGSPISLAIQRTQNFKHRKVFILSTPLIKGSSHIEHWYARSDQRKCYLPCPVCGEFQVLQFAQIKWAKNDPASALYHCAACGVGIEDHYKPAMLAGYEWRPTADGEGGRIKGYHLPGLYSPWLTWADIARAFTTAGKDPVKLKTFVTLILGETWDIDRYADRVDETELMSRREDWSADGECPKGVAVLTCGVDVQQDRVELEVVGWGRGEESWSVEYKTIYGDPSVDALWQELDGFLTTRRYTHPVFGDLPIAATCVDSGYATQSVYRFARDKSKRRIWAIKGRYGKLPVWGQTPTRRNKYKAPLHTIGVDSAKEVITARLRRREVGPGYMHFPMTRDETYFSQMQSNVWEPKARGGRWRLLNGRRDEALDCRVYSYAALMGLIATGGRTLDWHVDRLEAAQGLPPRNLGAALSTPTPAPSKPKRESYLSRQRGWLG